MTLLSHVNPPLESNQKFGPSPGDALEMAILRAYQLLLAGGSALSEQLRA